MVLWVSKVYTFFGDTVEGWGISQAGLLCTDWLWLGEPSQPRGTLCNDPQSHGRNDIIELIKNPL